MSEHRPTTCAATWITILALLGSLPAQQPEAPAADPLRHARSLVQQLELPQRRAAATAELLTLGDVAATALLARLDDPRPEVVRQLTATLAALGGLAAEALPALERLAADPTGPAAYAAALAAIAVRPPTQTLVVEYERGKVLRIEDDGEEHELFSGRKPWDVDLLPDGHVLVTQYIGSRVFELDAAGRQVWSFEDLEHPLEADRLGNGNTLIADSYHHRVIEVDRTGQIVWRFDLPAARERTWPYDVERLPTGTTLIALYPSSVVEVDAAGQVVWEIDGLDGVFDADRLPGGTTLLALYGAGEVCEVDRAGAVVWRHGPLDHPNDADRLADGSTWVADEQGLLRIAPDGSVERLRSGAGRVAEVQRR